MWLLAGGGTLYFAFPLLYASGFSGFYLPLMMVLWLLILRGIGIELRSACGFAGMARAVQRELRNFEPAARGVLRGGDRQRDSGRAAAARRFFFLPLWTNWKVGDQPGILDWYTVIAGLVALISLSLHGANYAALKTSGEMNVRARRAASGLMPALVAITGVSLAATLWIRPQPAGQLQRAAGAIRDSRAGSGFAGGDVADGADGE